MNKPNIMTPRTFFKPMDYPWAFTLWKQHESMHWMSTEVPMHEDVRDWGSKLTEGEKNLLTHLFRFFTQADVDVAAGYTTKFLPYFSHKPELAMMMSSFAAREAVHIDAYAVLLETLGMPETTYQQFADYKEMKDKHDYVSEFGTETTENLLKSLAVYAGFTEGMQLFASFVVLLNFSRFNKMKAMANIVAWSIRDESLHVDGMTTLFRTLMDELGTPEMRKSIPEEISKCAYKMVELEDAFIDLIYSASGEIEGLAPSEVKDYIRFISNKRWEQLGFSGSLFPEHTQNNLPWVDHIVNGSEHTNFFEQKSTFYSKAMTQGSFEEVEW